MASYDSPFSLGDGVVIDGDRELAAVVIAVEWHLDGSHTIKASWFHCGDIKESWFPAARLTPR